MISSFTPEKKPLNRRFINDYFDAQGHYNPSFSEQRRVEIKKGKTTCNPIAFAKSMETFYDILLIHCPNK